MTRARRGIVASTAAAATVLLCSAPAAEAAARFASPEGSGEACTQPLPCGIVTAVKKAALNDDVTIEPGTYDPIEDIFDEGHTLTIHGLAGAPRPVIVAKNGGFVLEGSGSILRDVEVDVPIANQTALYAIGFGETVERVLMHTLGTEDTACAGGGPITIADSVCVADGTKSIAFMFVVSSTVQATLRNDTLTAPGGSGPIGSVGVQTKAFVGHETQVTLINSIVHGSRLDLLASADSNPSSNGVIVAEHSNYATDAAEPESGGKASVTPHGTGTNQTAAPLFANAGTDDFHELAGSPTIAAGFSSPANGLADLDGVSRQFGGATDIGAYQFVPGPTCQALTATTGFGAATTLQLQCSDALGAPLTGYAIATGPAHGTAALNAATGLVTYTPSAGYSGPDGFTFDATSTHGTGVPAAAAHHRRGGARSSSGARRPERLPARAVCEDLRPAPARRLRGEDSPRHHDHLHRHAGRHDDVHGAQAARVGDPLARTLRRAAARSHDPRPALRSLQHARNVQPHGRRRGEPLPLHGPRSREGAQARLIPARLGAHERRGQGRSHARERVPRRQPLNSVRRSSVLAVHPAGRRVGATPAGASRASRQNSGAGPSTSCRRHRLALTGSMPSPSSSNTSRGAEPGGSATHVACELSPAGGAMTASPSTSMYTPPAHAPERRAMRSWLVRWPRPTAASLSTPSAVKSSTRYQSS